MSEASIGTQEERVAVGWTVLNRLDSGRFGNNIEDIVKSGYAYNQEPTQEITALAKDLLERKIQDSTARSTHFFSPRSMTSGFGPYKISGTNEAVLIPYWAIPRPYSRTSPPPLDWEITEFYQTIDNTEWVGNLNNVRNWYFMFYRPVTGPRAAVADYFQYPVKGYTVNGFRFGQNVPMGDYPERYHLGEDIIKPAAMSVHACANGIVRLANARHTGYGGLIVIEHALLDGTRYCSLYGHLDREKILVESGDVVERGQKIGEISGNPEDHANTVPHLHFGIRFGAFPGEDERDTKTTSGWYFGGYGKINPRVTTDWWMKASDFIRDHAQSWIEASAHSPVELRVYDSEGRLTGVVDGEIKAEIPDSGCFGETVIILSPSDSYSYEVAGTSEGSYQLTVTKAAEQTSSFTLTEIPVSAKAMHQYIIDWNTLSQGAGGVTMKMDSDGDGTFERTIYLSTTEQKKGSPWVWIVAGALIAAVAAFMIRLRIAGRHSSGESDDDA